MRIWLSTIAALAAVSSASAADLPVKAPPPPLPAPVLNWTGFYIGANGGYSWGRAGRTLNFFSPVTGATIFSPVGTGTTSDSNMNGGLFGGQIGYNWQSANWVFGLETDAQWTGQRGSASATCAATATALGCLPGITALPAGAIGTTATIDQKLEWFGTFRARAGVLVVPNVLLYATGGAAYGTIKSDVTIASLTPAGVAITGVGSSSDQRFGWTVGAGVESMFGANWSGKLEYLYMDLGTVNNTGVVTTGAGLGIGANLSTRVTDHIFRAGINYHFGPGRY